MRVGPHVVGYHEGGVHMGEIHLCDVCFRWALNAGFIDEPYIDPDEYDRRVRE